MSLFESRHPLIFTLEGYDEVFSGGRREKCRFDYVDGVLVLKVGGGENKVDVGLYTGLLSALSDWPVLIECQHGIHVADARTVRVADLSFSDRRAIEERFKQITTTEIEVARKARITSVDHLKAGAVALQFLKWHKQFD